MKGCFLGNVVALITIVVVFGNAAFWTLLWFPDPRPRGLAEFRTQFPSAWRRLKRRLRRMLAPRGHGGSDRA